MARRVPVYKFGPPPGARKAIRPLIKNRLLSVEREILPEMKQIMLEYMQDTVLLTLASTKIKKRSGRMFATLRAGPRVTGAGVDSLTGTYYGSGAAKIHEYGGTIRPVKAKALAIPMPAALRADGTPKLSGPLAWKRRHNTFIYRNKSTRRAYIVYKKPSGGLTFLYRLVDKVTIKPQLGLRKTHERRLGSLMREWGNLVVAGMKSIDVYKYVTHPNRPQPFRVSGFRRALRPISVSLSVVDSFVDSIDEDQ